MRNSTLDLVFLTALAAGFVYFAVDALVGSSGEANRAPLRAEIQALEAEIQALETERERLARKVARLAGPEIDPELLDERLREALGVIGADEALVIESGSGLDGAVGDVPAAPSQ